MSSADPSSASADDGKLLLGVDGGGSKTAAWLAQCRSDSYDVVGRGKAGSSNVRAVGAETGFANLAAAIAAARADARLSDAEIDSAVFGLAGSGHAPTAGVIREWIETNHVAQTAELVHDARPVIAAGTRDNWGVALIAGTGSSAYGISDRGQVTAAVGGWGYLFGDEGSGYWIGREAAAAVSHAADGLIPPTALTERIYASLEIDDARAMLAALRDSGEMLQALAGLAPLTLVCAEHGDAAALEIADRAAHALAKIAAATAAQIRGHQGYPLALAGGVLCGSELLRHHLLIRLTELDAEPDSVEVVPDPVVGCLELARNMVNR